MFFLSSFNLIKTNYSINFNVQSYVQSGTWQFVDLNLSHCDFKYRICKQILLFGLLRSYTKCWMEHALSKPWMIIEVKFGPGFTFLYTQPLFNLISYIYIYKIQTNIYQPNSNFQELLNIIRIIIFFSFF